MPRQDFERTTTELTQCRRLLSYCFRPGVLAVVFGTTTLFHLARGGETRKRHRGPRTTSAQITFGPIGEQGPVVSPNGKWLAVEYVDKAKIPQIWVMPSDVGFKAARPLVANGNRKAAPTWSPDSQWVAFMWETVKENFATDDIYKVNLGTGEMVNLTHFPTGFPGDGIAGDVVQWLADDRIAFEYNGGISTVPSSGGCITELLNIDAVLKSSNLYEARVSPDGKHIAIAYSEPTDPLKLRIAVIDVQTRKLLLPLKGVWARFPEWINNDWLLYSRARKSGVMQIWALCLSTGRSEQLTDGPLDIEPVFSAPLGAIFFAHSTKLDTLYDFHIWRKPVSQSTMELWSSAGVKDGVRKKIER
jgi:dipeptidyl aminopeptidase/acylaminoacyl peptidase